ncbi:hypothetical protein ACN28G_25740 [Micromonospora sp. WMMA1923]
MLPGTVLPGQPVLPGGTAGPVLPGVPGGPGAVGGLPGPAPGPTGLGPVATACADGPTGSRVIALLRGPAAVLPDRVQTRVRTGPLCADDWHYTVLDVTGHEELQVVTRGRSNAPELVTAGTDVCSAEVRATAPAGIRTLACPGEPGA